VYLVNHNNNNNNSSTASNNNSGQNSPQIITGNISPTEVNNLENHITENTKVLEKYDTKVLIKEETDPTIILESGKRVSCFSLIMKLRWRRLVFNY